MLKVTRKFIEDGKRPKRGKKGGAWTKKQMELLGESWPPEKGWIDRAIGRELTDEQVETFMAQKTELRPLRERDDARNPCYWRYDWDLERWWYTNKLITKPDEEFIP